jgi:transcription elongation factor Elf1
MLTSEYLCPFGNELVSVKQSMSKKKVIPVCENCGTVMAEVTYL